MFGNEPGVDLPLGVETKQGSNERLHIAEVILPVWICRVNKAQNKGLRRTDDDYFTHLHSVKIISKTEK